MGVTKEKILEIVKRNKSITNSQIARTIIEEGKYDPFLMEQFRKKVSRIRSSKDYWDYVGRIPIVSEEDKLLVNVLHDEIDSVPNILSNSKSTLIIGDLHEPYCHKDYLKFNMELADKFKCDNIVFIGDILDCHSVSYHEHNPNLSSPKDELEFAKEKLSHWYKAFPKAVVLMGNHDDLFARKIFTAGLPSDIMKPFNVILGLNNWEIKNEHIIDNTYFTHGTKLSTMTIKEKALRLQKNVVCGHLHSESYIRNITQSIWVSHIGCGVDFSSASFNYAKGGSKEPLLSSLVIMNGQPILIMM